MGENVADFPDSMDGAAILDQSVEKGGRRRRGGIVAAVAGALEVGRRLADEGAGDHASDVVVVDEAAGDLADLVKAFEAEMGLVGRNLVDAVGRGVDDGLAAADVLLAEFGNDGGAGGMAVPQDTGHTRLPDECFGQGGGEARPGVGEVAPIKGDRQAGHFPMTARRILAETAFGGEAPDAFRFDGAVEALRHGAGRSLRGPGQAEACKVGK